MDRQNLTSVSEVGLPLVESLDEKWGIQHQVKVCIP